MYTRCACAPLFLSLTGLLACDPAEAELTPLEPASLSSDQSLFAGPDGEMLASEITMEHLAVAPRLIAGVDQVELETIKIDDRGIAHSHLTQLQDGIPVWGAEAIMHFTPAGTLFHVSDSLVRDLSVDTRADYQPMEALDLALEDMATRTDFSEMPDVSLWVVPGRDGQQDALAWQVRVRNIEDTDRPSIPVRFIDAHSGEVLFGYDDLQTASLSDSDKVTYDMGNGTSYGGASVGDSSDAELDTTHDAIGDTLAYLSASFGRDSFDDSGAVVRSYGHYSSSYVNAFWDGSRLTFGDGDGYYSNYLGVLDVAAHELGHALTDYEANLTYSYESGALNEAASDMLAAAVEAYVDGGTSADTWDIGEDCWVQPGTTALRYMASPSDDGSSRDHYSDRYTGSSDNGGVHWNSGIANHWFYLLSEGGQHHDSSFRSGYTVSGIGIDDAYAIWYEALTSYMTSSTNFSGARTATESACAALGYATADCDAVSYAWYEVGVGSDPSSGGGGGGGGSTGSSCGSSQTSYTGSLSGSGSSAVEPGGTYYYDSSPAADLYGASGTDFDLYMYRWQRSRWRLADSSTSSSSNESVSSSRTGYFYYSVSSYSGSGSYELCVD